MAFVPKIRCSKFESTVNIRRNKSKPKPNNLMLNWRRTEKRSSICCANTQGNCERCQCSKKFLIFDTSFRWIHLYICIQFYSLLFCERYNANFTALFTIFLSLYEKFAHLNLCQCVYLSPALPLLCLYVFKRSVLHLWPRCRR